MSVPGLGFPMSGRTVSVLSSDTTTFNLADELGNPTTPVYYTLIVSTGALRGSTTVSSPALDASGLHEDSHGLWRVFGSLVGKGGDGADGNTGIYGVEGAGGGGAGNVVGQGGTATAPATDGADGLLLTGGAGGTSDPTPGPPAVFYSPENGGDAVKLNHTVECVISGTIRGGGGGGRSGLVIVDTGPVYYTAGQGGDLDEDGWFNGSQAGGSSKGYAVRLIGATASFSYSGSGFVGTVGA